MYKYPIKLAQQPTTDDNVKDFSKEILKLKEYLKNATSQQAHPVVSDPDSVKQDLVES